MLTVKTTENGTAYVDQTQDVGNIDYVKNGEVYKNNPAKSVMVSGQADLASLTGYGPGTMAYTAGYKSMWQLSVSGEWVAV